MLFFKSRLNKIYLRSNLKPGACEDIYLPLVANETSGGRIVNTNQLLNTKQPQKSNQLLCFVIKVEKNSTLVNLFARESHTVFFIYAQRLEAYNIIQFVYKSKAKVDL